MFSLFRRKDQDDDFAENMAEEPLPIAVYENLSHSPVNSAIASVQFVGATAVATLTVTELLGPESAHEITSLFGRLHDGGVMQIVLDAQSVQQVDQAAFAALVGSCNTLVQAGGRVALAGATATLQQAMRTTGLDRVFPMCSDVMAAMNAVERRASTTAVLGW